MISTLWLIFMSFHQGQFFFKKNLAFASPDLVPKLTLKLSTRRTFEALSSSGPFQELITLTSNCKLWVVLGLYHLIFIKVFLYLRVWGQIGIVCKAHSFWWANSRLLFFLWAICKVDASIKDLSWSLEVLLRASLFENKMAFASPNLFPRLTLNLRE